MDFDLSSEPLKPEQLRQHLLSKSAGAYLSFEGWVRARNDGRDVQALEYEAYGVLAHTEGQAILEEARTRFRVLGIKCSHRTGKLGLGELAVWVGVVAEHRGDAFEACRYVIDELKARVPIWKKEYYVGGESAWVNSATRGVHAPHTEKR